MTVARDASEAESRSAIARFSEYLADTRGEFDKINWPSRKETIGGTIGVLVVVGVITLVLSVVDVALVNVVRLVLP